MTNHYKKECLRCGIKRTLDNFYKQNFNKDGLFNTCKICHRKKSRSYYYENRNERINYEITRYQNPIIKKQKILNQYKYRKENPIPYLAYQKVSKAIKKGKIIKLSCKICGSINSQGHHPDYSKPLNVIWLCKIHHAELHRKPLYV